MILQHHAFEPRPEDELMAVVIHPFLKNGVEACLSNKVIEKCIIFILPYGYAHRIWKNRGRMDGNG